MCNWIAPRLKELMLFDPYRKAEDRAVADALANYWAMRRPMTIDATGWAEAAFPRRRAVTNCIIGGLETTDMAIARRWEADGAEVRYIDG